MSTQDTTAATVAAHEAAVANYQKGVSAGYAKATDECLTRIKGLEGDTVKLSEAMVILRELLRDLSPALSSLRSVRNAHNFLEMLEKPRG